MNAIDNRIASFIQELDAEQQKHVTDAMAEEKQRVLTLDELVDAVGRIQKVPDKDRIAKIVELLDEDRDGTINQVTKMEDPLPFKTGKERTLMNIDTLFVSGGEGGGRLHASSFLVKSIMGVEATCHYLTLDSPLAYFEIRNLFLKIVIVTKNFYKTAEKLTRSTYGLKNVMQSFRKSLSEFFLNFTQQIE